ncbi:MAG TPA: glyoxylate/hydroxypyruvate reductase A [Rhizomicrobium sp.]
MGLAPNVLLQFPAGWNALGSDLFDGTGLRVLRFGADDYAPEEIDYVVAFRPPPGFLKTLPRLKAIFSLGAGVDGFLKDPEFPRAVPLVRFVDVTLAREMAQYVVMHTLLIHRHQRHFDEGQKKKEWRQMMLPRPSAQTRVGILGLGEIGSVAAERLAMFDFAVSGWSRTAKHVAGVKSFAGEAALGDFLGQCDIMACLLPLTPQTQGILNAKTFAALPKGAWIINVARGQHLIEADLIAALDYGHLAGAVLDVFQSEPLPVDSPLWTHPKVTVTPHIAAISAPQAAVDYIGRGIAQAERGETLENVVDVGKGY